MRRLSANSVTLLCTAAVATGSIAPSFAASVKESSRKKALSSTALHAPAAHKKSGPVQAGKAEEITVSSGVTPNGVTGRSAGGGMMPRQTEAFSKSGVTRDYIAAQAPATNALTLVKNTPGVIVASADPTGATDRMSVYSWYEPERTGV